MDFELVWKLTYLGESREVKVADLTQPLSDLAVAIRGQGVVATFGYKVFELNDDGKPTGEPLAGERFGGGMGSFPTVRGVTGFGILPFRVRRFGHHVLWLFINQEKTRSLFFSVVPLDGGDPG